MKAYIIVVLLMPESPNQVKYLFYNIFSKTKNPPKKHSNVV